MNKLFPVLLAAVSFNLLAAQPVLADERWREERRYDEHRHWDERGDWHRGYWVHAWREGRDGWWWVVGPYWHYYPQPYPGPPPVIVFAPPPGPPPVIVEAPPQAPPPSSGGIDKSTGGTVLGAIGGGVAGAQFGHGSGKIAATVVGTLLGAFVGHEVGASLDRADQLAAQNATQAAVQAPLGQAISWNNPENGHSGVITPTRDGTDSNGNTCREFQQTVTIDGKSEQAYGTTCRQPDGSWKVIQ
jgi:surface antigen